jgi:tetratricopeptide (TPR) repeat protein
VTSAATIRVVTGALALGLALTATAFARVPAPQQAKEAKDDEVVLKDKATEKGKIVAENYDTLELEVKKGVKKKLEWSRIDKVVYGSTPAEYTEAAAERGNDPEGALEKLKALSAKEGLGDVWRQLVLFDVASLQQQLGAFDEAIAGWNALIAAFPEGRYLGTAARGLVDSHLGKGDADGAGKALETFKGSPAVGKFEALGIEVKTLNGRILMAQGKFADARAAFEQAEKDPKATPDVAAIAKLGVAECLKLEGKASDAEARFKAIVEGDGPSFLLAGAWNGLGDLLSEKGKTARNADAITEALFAYLRGVVQYTPGPGEPQDEYERAIAGSAKCFKLLSQLETNKDRKAYYDGQANAATERLRKLSPNSEYLKQL